MALSCRPAVTPEFLFEIRGSPPAIAMVTTGGQARKIEQIRNLLFFGMSVSRSTGGTSAIRNGLRSEMNGNASKRDIRIMNYQGLILH